MKNDLRVSINCHRCGGLMVCEEFYDPHDHFWGWRCILCGEIIDQVILENRQCAKKKGEDTGRRRAPIIQEHTSKRVN
jgi:hypothetical protein